MKENDKFIVREYQCIICNEIHQIKLNKDLKRGQKQFPFPYFFLHGDLKNILTTLYIDKNFEIRGVDVHELTHEDLFSKDQVKSITNTLIEEIERLRLENSKLREELKRLK